MRAALASVIAAGLSLHVQARAESSQPILWRDNDDLPIAEPAENEDGDYIWWDGVRRNGRLVFGQRRRLRLYVNSADSLDGAIARLTNSRTKLGAYMDPLTDKMLILSAFVVFASMDVVPRWLTVVVISRDVIILIGYLSLFLLTQQIMEIRPSAISKAATFLQLATLSAVLLSLWRSEMVGAGTRSALFGGTGWSRRSQGSITSIWACAGISRRAGRLRRRHACNENGFFALRRRNFPAATGFDSANAMQLDRDAAEAAEAFDSFPEIILPAQFELGSRLAVALGERRLLWAMLLDAAACFYKHGHARDNSGRNLFREAERWIRSSNAGWPFSFQAVCDVLGLNAQQVRVSLLQCVYGSGRDPILFTEEGRRTGERRPRQLRHASGSRGGGGNGAPRVRSYRASLGGRGDPLARTVSNRG